MLRQAYRNQYTPQTTYEEYAQRFWSYTLIGGEDDCWLWQKGRYDDGYGRFHFMGRDYAAHRIGVMFYRGKATPPPAHLLALHKCDNPPCVNPTHIFLGSQRDNILDAMRKGRRTNENCNNARFTREIIEFVRADTKHTYRELAEMFDTDSAAISHIKNYQSYADPQNKYALRTRS